MRVWPCARHGGGEGMGSLWSWLPASLAPAPALHQGYVALRARPARPGQGRPAPAAVTGT